jgi:hypothetical protein
MYTSIMQICAFLNRFIGFVPANVTLRSGRAEFYQKIFLRWCISFFHIALQLLPVVAPLSEGCITKADFILMDWSSRLS